MPSIEIKTHINCDIQTCFDLARSIDIHKKSLEHTSEIPISGKTTGLIELGEWVSWEAKHLGFVQHLTSKIIEFDKPNFFVGEMVFGAFKSLRHEHFFRKFNGGTLMIDRLYFESPHGLLGHLANVLFLKRYMSKLLKTRNKILKREAESMCEKNLASKASSKKKEVVF